MIRFTRILLGFVAILAGFIVLFAALVGFYWLMNWMIGV